MKYIVVKDIGAFQLDEHSTCLLHLTQVLGASLPILNSRAQLHQNRIVREVGAEVPTSQKSSPPPPPPPATPCRAMQCLTNRYIRPSGKPSTTYSRLNVRSYVVSAVPIQTGYAEQPLPKKEKKKERENQFYRVHTSKYVRQGQFRQARAGTW